MQSQTSMRSDNVEKHSRQTAGQERPGAQKPGSERCPSGIFADLYSGLDDPAIKRDLDRADADCVAFEEAYKGKLAELARVAEGRRGARRSGAPL